MKPLNSASVCSGLAGVFAAAVVPDLDDEDVFVAVDFVVGVVLSVGSFAFLAGASLLTSAGALSAC